MAFVTVLGFAAPASADQFSILDTVEVSGTASGTTFPSFGGTGTPLLDQFEYRYSSTDHHLKTLASRPRTSDIEIAFADNNNDDVYTYRVAYQRVSPSGINVGSLHIICDGGSCTRAITRPPGDVIFTITGYKFRFDSLDHHTDGIGIIENNGQLTTWFDDGNGDDNYTADVDFAWVPRSRFGTVAEVSGRVHAAGSAITSTVAGNKVIRGFFVDYTSGDNHIQSLGVRTNPSTIEVLYADKNPADSVDWTYRVQFAVLL